MSTGLDRVWDHHMIDANRGWRRRTACTAIGEALQFLLVLALASAAAFLAAKALGLLLGWLIHLGQHWTDLPR